MSQSRKLFACGVAYLHRREGLEEALTEGLYTRRRLALARHLAGIASSARQTFVIERIARDVKAIEDVFRWITHSIFENQPVLIPLMGGLDHMSVVSGITDKQVILFDSSGMNYVRKSSCAVRGEYHQISPNGLMRVSRVASVK